MVIPLFQELLDKENSLSRWGGNCTGSWNFNMLTQLQRLFSNKLRCFNSDWKKHSIDLSY